jgi:ribosome-associated toxin RatA of RatAB toxin-antitoxin module
MASTSRTIHIDAPAASVIAVIAAIEDYPSWISSMRSVEVLSRDRQRRPTRASFTVEQGMIKDRFTLDYTWRRDGVSWVLVEGQLQRTQTGSYTVTADGDGCEVRYDLDVELTVPMLGAMVRTAERAIVETALAGLKRRVEGEG